LINVYFQFSIACSSATSGIIVVFITVELYFRDSFFVFPLRRKSGRVIRKFSTNFCSSTKQSNLTPSLPGCRPFFPAFILNYLVTSFYRIAQSDFQIRSKLAGNEESAGGNMATYDATLDQSESLIRTEPIIGRKEIIKALPVFFHLSNYMASLLIFQHRSK